MTRSLKSALIVFVLVAVCPLAQAEDDVASGDSVGSGPAYDYLSDAESFVVYPEGFGLVDNSVVAIFQQSFNGRTAADDALREQSSAYRHCSGSCWLDTSVELPSGARVTGVEIDLDDTNSAGTVFARVYECPVGNSGCNIITTVESGSSAVPGAVQLFGATNFVVLNGLNAYDLSVRLTGGDATTKFLAVRLFYKRQISPAPGVATFMDVPTNHPFFSNVEALAASGITGGGGGNYCPDNFVTRAQMAAFLSRALGLHWDGF